MEFLLRVEELSVNPKSPVDFKSMKDYDGSCEMLMDVRHILYDCSSYTIAEMFPKISLLTENKIFSLSIVGLFLATPTAKSINEVTTITGVPKAKDLVVCGDVVYVVNAFIPLLRLKYLYWDSERRDYMASNALLGDVNGMDYVPSEVHALPSLYDVLLAKTTDATMLTLDAPPNDNDIIQYMKRTKYAGGSL